MTNSNEPDNHLESDYEDRNGNPDNPNNPDNDLILGDWVGRDEPYEPYEWDDEDESDI